ncbi:MAG: hypothetical protein L0220_17435, partial [Acidobacteria bacterium]|nr:hypothetical protein [Acidobacteriota bacterium]
GLVSGGCSKASTTGTTEFISPALKGRQKSVALSGLGGLSALYPVVAAKPPPPANIRLCLRHEELCRCL